MMGIETFDDNSEREWPASPGPESPTSESAHERLLPAEEIGNAEIQDGEKSGEQEKKKTPPPPGTATLSSFVVREYDTSASSNADGKIREFSHTPRTVTEFFFS